jgi:Tfp pilus assembly protein PilF
MRGNQPAAERMLVRAKANALAKLSNDPLSKENRILVARIQARLGSADEAEQTLKAGLALLPGDKDLNRTLAALDLARYDKASNSQRSVEDRIDQLLRASAAVDDPTVIFDRMVQIYQSSNAPEHRTRVREFLEEALKTDEKSALTHFVLSIIAVLEDQPERAIAYLERSLELAPSQHLVKNNLAWLLSKRTPPELDRALMLSQSAIELAPNIPTYHDTLGSIFLLRGEYPDAVIELERALVGMPEAQRKNVHEKLATAYRALGNTELADMHAARSQK